jgi:hypothetical protein
MFIENKSIEDWCKYFRFKNYEIVNDVVNVNGNVHISEKGLKLIPIQFGIVTGEFCCEYNLLISLKGSPVKVGGDFCCYDNMLKSLKGCPREVDGDFHCFINNITSLKGGPSKIGGVFDCHKNPIHEEFIKYDNYTHYMRSIKLKKLIWKSQ